MLLPIELDDCLGRGYPSWVSLAARYVFTSDLSNSSITLPCSNASTSLFERRLPVSHTPNKVVDSLLCDPLSSTSCFCHSQRVDWHSKPAFLNHDFTRVASILPHLLCSISRPHICFSRWASVLIKLQAITFLP